MSTRQIMKLNISTSFPPPFKAVARFKRPRQAFFSFEQIRQQLGHRPLNTTPSKLVYGTKN